LFAVTPPPLRVPKKEKGRVAKEKGRVAKEAACCAVEGRLK
jgi:hypothetical protein